MPTVTPHQDSTDATPIPHPTHPVAGRVVESPVPTFDWTPLPEVEAFRLQIARTDAFETTYYDETVGRPVSVELDTIVPDEASTVYWRVRPEAGERGRPWSEAAHFALSTRAVDDAVVVDAEPVPVHPASGDAVDPGAAAFVWEGVPEASGYQLQVLTDDGGDRLVNLPLDRTTSVVLYDQLPDEHASLRWRVRSLFPTEATGPWSPGIVFGTSPGTEGDEDAFTTRPAPEEGKEETTPDGAVAAGPAQRARTGRTGSIAFILLIILGFLLAAGLVAWVG